MIRKLKSENFFKIPEGIPEKFAIAVYAISIAFKPELASAYWKCVTSRSNKPHALRWIKKLFIANDASWNAEEQKWWSLHIHRSELN